MQRVAWSKTSRLVYVVGVLALVLSPAQLHAQALLMGPSMSLEDASSQFANPAIFLWPAHMYVFGFFHKQ